MAPAEAKQTTLKMAPAETTQKAPEATTKQPAGGTFFKLYIDAKEFTFKLLYTVSADVRKSFDMQVKTPVPNFGVIL